MKGFAMLAGVLAFWIGWTSAQARADVTIAYDVPGGTQGDQSWTGPLGMDFDVLKSIRVTQLGVFDDGADGLASALKAELVNRDTGQILRELEFTPPDQGTLAGGSRFKMLATPLDLYSGFHGTIVAEGYGQGERNGNSYGSPPPWSINSGDGALAFVGSGRYGSPGPSGAYPMMVDTGPVNRYAAGTFAFEPGPAAPPPAPPTNLHVAYAVPYGTLGDQSWPGPMGMDFDVRKKIEVVQLGVFDDGSGGLSSDLKAELFNRDTGQLVQALEFTNSDGGLLVGGSRFKPLTKPLVLEPGFHGTIAAVGYGPNERNGNSYGSPAPWFTDPGDGDLAFVGSSRYDYPDSPSAYPSIIDTGPVNRYAAGTFMFRPASLSPSPASSPVPVPPSSILGLLGAGSCSLLGRILRRRRVGCSACN